MGPIRVTRPGKPRLLACYTWGTGSVFFVHLLLSILDFIRTGAPVLIVAAHCTSWDVRKKLDNQSGSHLYCPGQLN